MFAEELRITDMRGPYEWWVEGEGVVMFPPNVPDGASVPEAQGDCKMMDR